MIKTKTKPQPQSKPEASAEVSLADRIRAVCAEADQYIESKVKALKATADCRPLPIDWLRQDLKNRHGGNCACRVALSLMDNENG